MFIETAVSELKTKYPLSRRKFWKKMIEKFFIFLFTSFVIGGIFAGIGFFMFGLSVNNTSNLLWLGVFSYILAFVIQSLIYKWYVGAYIRSYYYHDEKDFLTIRKGVFTPAEIHVQYLKMQDVYVDQDILDRILGIYDVHISSATYSSGVASHIDGVDKEVSVGLKNLFLEKIKNASTGNSGKIGMQNIHNSSVSESVTVTETNVSTPIEFSNKISSDIYGLSKDWWVSEFTKIALGSIFLPLILSFWGFSTFLDGRGNSHTFFWIWFSILIVYYIVCLLRLWLWQMHYKYEFGTEYIYMKEGILSISEKNMGYNTIQDVRIHQTLVDRLFRVADVIIENASANNVPQYQKNGKVVSNGIVIEGLSLTDAKQIVEEVKTVLISKVGLNKGL